MSVVVVVSGEDRDKLRDNLSKEFDLNEGAHWSTDATAYGDGNARAHHVIPVAVASQYEDMFNAIANYSQGDVTLGFDLNDSNNGVFLPKDNNSAIASASDGKHAVVHAGPHTAYSNFVNSRIAEVEQSFNSEINAINASGGTDDDRYRAAQTAMRQIRALQENLKAGMVSDVATNLVFFLYGSDSVMVSKYGSSTSGAVLDYMNSHVYNDNNFNAEFINKMTSVNHLVKVVEPDGKIKYQFDVNTINNIKGAADVQLLGGLATVLTAGLTVYALSKMVADYLGQNEVTFEQLVEFLEHTNLDIDLEALMIGLAEGAAEAALITLAKALGGPFMIVGTAYEVYENYNALKAALELAVAADPENEMLQDFLDKFYAMEEAFSALFPEQPEASNNQDYTVLEIDASSSLEQPTLNLNEIDLERLVLRVDIDGGIYEDTVANLRERFPLLEISFEPKFNEEYGTHIESSVTYNDSFQVDSQISNPNNLYKPPSYDHPLAPNYDPINFESIYEGFATPLDNLPRSTAIGESSSKDSFTEENNLSQIYESDSRFYLGVDGNVYYVYSNDSSNGWQSIQLNQSQIEQFDSYYSSNNHHLGLFSGINTDSYELLDSSGGVDVYRREDSNEVVVVNESGMLTLNFDAPISVEITGFGIRYTNTESGAYYEIDANGKILSYSSPAGEITYYDESNRPIENTTIEEIVVGRAESIDDSLHPGNLVSEEYNSEGALVQRYQDGTVIVWGDSGYTRIDQFGNKSYFVDNGDGSYSLQFSSGTEFLIESNTDRTYSMTPIDGDGEAIHLSSLSELSQIIDHTFDTLKDAFTKITNLVDELIQVYTEEVFQNEAYQSELLAEFTRRILQGVVVNPSRTLC